MNSPNPVVILPRGSPQSLAEAASLNEHPLYALMEAIRLIRQQEQKVRDETEKRKEETSGKTGRVGVHQSFRQCCSK
jgi:hypothetical protein